MPRKYHIPTGFWHKIWDPVANLEHLMLHKAIVIVPLVATAAAEELVHNEATFTAMMNMEFP